MRCPRCLLLALPVLPALFALPVLHALPVLPAVPALPSLPASREEVRLAGEVSGASERILLVGGDATEARLRLLAEAEYSVVLFATHGLMEGELGGLREPALVLTPGSGTGGTTDDGILLAGEIGASR